MITEIPRYNSQHSFSFENKVWAVSMWLW